MLLCLEVCFDDLEVVRLSRFWKAGPSTERILDLGLIKVKYWYQCNAMQSDRSPAGIEVFDSLVYSKIEKCLIFQ